MNDRFSRQSFLGTQAEDVFQTVRVGIVGLGGGGSHIATQLAYLGVRHFALFDPDALETSNLNRTIGARNDDPLSRTLKVDIARRTILGVNPDARPKAVPKQWQEAIEVLRNCDIVFGCVDGFSQRAQLEQVCRSSLIPLIDIGMDVFHNEHYSISGQITTSVPGEACLRCMRVVTEESLAIEGQRYGAAGIHPQVVWSNGVLASTAVGVFVHLVLPWCPRRFPALIGYDGNAMLLESDPRLLVSGNKCMHYKSQEVGDPLWTGLDATGEDAWA